MYIYIYKVAFTSLFPSCGLRSSRSSPLAEPIRLLRAVHHAIGRRRRCLVVLLGRFGALAARLGLEAGLGRARQLGRLRLDAEAGAGAGVRQRQ